LYFVFYCNLLLLFRILFTGPPNAPVLFCWLASVVCRRLSGSVTLLAGRPDGSRARRRSGGRHCTAGQCGYVPLGRHLVFQCCTDVCYVPLNTGYLCWWSYSAALRVSTPALTLSLIVARAGHKARQSWSQNAPIYRILKCRAFAGTDGEFERTAGVD